MDGGVPPNGLHVASPKEVWLCIIVLEKFCIVCYYFKITYLFPVQKDIFRSCADTVIIIAVCMKACRISQAAMTLIGLPWKGLIGHYDMITWCPTFSLPLKCENINWRNHVCCDTATSGSRILFHVVGMSLKSCVLTCTCNHQPSDNNYHTCSSYLDIVIGQTKLSILFLH